MAVGLEQFVKQLADSGVIAPGKLENFVPPKAQPKDAQELARQLVQSKHLTKFQAQEIFQGRAKSLILGNYTILDKIGAGGMGQVFKAQHRRMDRVVAIKMLPTAITTDAAAVARFQREVKAAAKLSHPNIVAAYDADEANGVHFLAMEYVEGSDLSALVKKNGPFSVIKAINYTLQAARGLQFAHKKGVIHRDIKPANLLLDDEGTVKILDMGLARMGTTDDDVTQAELTGAGAVLGTVDYMAPEQALSTHDADARADIYSLGCTLHYFIAGKATYDGNTLMAKLLAHREMPIPSMGADMPSNVQAVFEKMVAKKINDRFQTMSEVVAQLEKCQSELTAAMAGSTAAWNAQTTNHNSEPLLAVPDDKGPPKKNSKLLVGAGAAGFLLVLLGVIVIIRNQKGEEVGRLELPPGHTAEVQDGAKAVPATPAKPITDFNSPAFKQWMKEVAAMPAEKQVEAVAKKLQELNPGFDGRVTGLFGEGPPKIENGAVTELAFCTDSVADISPVRALAGLRCLWCIGGGPGKGKLSDVSPLRSMPLAELNCGWTQVSDLSPLKGMRLEKLNCDSDPVKDWSPLEGMNLSDIVFTPKNMAKGIEIVRHMKSITKIGLTGAEQSPPGDFWKRYDAGNFGKPITDFNSPAFKQWMKEVAAMAADEQVKAVSKKLQELNPGFDGKITGTGGSPTPKIDNGVVTEIEFHADDVADMSPVRALAGLKHLCCGGSGENKGKIVDLSPLRGMNLTNLNCGCSQVFDLSPLNGMPLEELCLCYTNVSELSPLKGMPLAGLNCAETRVSDLSPLHGMPLASLDIVNTKVSDLSPLKGAPLAHLDCGGTQVADLSALKGMPLQSLFVGGTNVSSLSALAGTPLIVFGCARTKVSDLSPLKGLPLTDLGIHETKVTDLLPLDGSCLTKIAFTPKNIAKGIAGIRHMKTLENIGIGWDEKDKFTPDVFWKKFDAGEFNK